MSTKFIVKRVAIVATMLVLAYGVGAFGAMSFNPNDWKFEARTMVAAFSSFIVIAAILTDK